MQTPPLDDHVSPCPLNGHKAETATTGTLSSEEVQALLAAPQARAGENNESGDEVHHPVHARDSNTPPRTAGPTADLAAFRQEAHNHPMALSFTKMHATGNDYVYIEEFDAPIKDPAALAVAVCNRHFGVGGHGLVLLGPSSEADFRMRIFNAAGFAVGMCGNAALCAGKYLFEKGRTSRRGITLETMVGIRYLLLEPQGSTVTRVRVDMGKPRLAPSALPMLASGDSFINRKITVNGKTYWATAVFMGNPHLVIPFFGIDLLDLSQIGPQFERHPFFPCGVNTEFVEVRDRSRIRMRTWERGTGESLACGTGACAALVACALNDLTDYTATVEPPGGELCVEWDGLGEIFMAGDAEFICSGEYYMK